ncbi:type II toxin-antitoxin system HipA family toxin [Nocardia sp. NPDC057663]|uniref:type II toxin-antitoxin system HipA family toxin n=1 Tax=Nocardia sp. NPDC057663 TaxID=3346201 RepID=UPI003672EC84
MSSRDYPTSIYDEEYGARIVRAADLADFQTWIAEFDGVSALVIERYDRAQNAPGGRIHQEDFSQILGATGDQKYQRFGGRVSLERIAKTLMTTVGREPVARLLRMTTAAVAVGNLDMHAKNISLLHPPDGSAGLAPAYDFVPQVHQPNDGEMALAIDQEYRHRAITRAQLVAEGQRWGLRNADDLVESALASVLDTVETELPHPRAYPELQSDIARFASNLRAGRPAGRQT